MRLWSFLAVLAAVLACAVMGFGYAAEHYLPTEANDHLLDGVPGLGGPKAAKT